MIHVSSDCILAGIGPFSSSIDHPAPADTYGRSKLAGEVLGNPKVLNVRTSFVGPEHGLWKWVADQPPGAEIEGWENALWTGSTVQAVAKSLVDIAVSRYPWEGGVLHLSTKTWRSKADVVRAIAQKIGRTDLNIRPVLKPSIDRRLVPDLPLQEFGEALREW
jgi:dTDP-4-dehydrorhamnose reductase